MDSKNFKDHGREMVDYIADYQDNLLDRSVFPKVQPGYLKKLLPEDAPHKPENWEDIMKDVEDKILPGVTHWQHPRFHAYFPSGNSYPSILGDMLSSGLGCIGFSWASSPACTELENIVVNWLGKALNLPEGFLFGENSKGGGVIQSSASECVLVSFLAAREKKITQLMKEDPDADRYTLLSKLTAYCSSQAHSCAEKAAKIAFVRLRQLEPDSEVCLRGSVVQKAMEEDKANGLIPFYVEATLGTTSCCSFDNIAEIGPLCQENDVWLHVDGAYAGSSFICPELRGPFEGIHYASSFNLNTNKFLLTNFDCSVMWVQDQFSLTQSMNVDPIYLQHSYSEAVDYRHWGINLSRRFRSLKLWFVLRSYGITGLQQYVREHCRLAKLFEEHVKQDTRFELTSKAALGLVTFRLNGSDELNENLLTSINDSGRLHMIKSKMNNQLIIRFCICAENASDDDVDYAWETIQEFSHIVLGTVPETKDAQDTIQEEETLEEEEEVNNFPDDVLTPLITLIRRASMEQMLLGRQNQHGLNTTVAPESIKEVPEDQEEDKEEIVDVFDDVISPLITLMRRASQDQLLMMQQKKRQSLRRRRGSRLSSGSVSVPVC
ncbi:unnamed protein product, partial [Meganyctiphanes norvegica]